MCLPENMDLRETGNDQDMGNQITRSLQLTSKDVTLYSNHVAQSPFK